MSESPGGNERNGIEYKRVMAKINGVDLVNLDEIVAHIKVGLQQDDPGKANFQVPQLGNPTSIDSMEYFVLFLELIVEDEWLNENAITVLFDMVLQDGRKTRGLGFGLSKDEVIWTGEQGKEHLKTDQINIYYPEEYLDLIKTSLAN